MRFVEGGSLSTVETVGVIRRDCSCAESSIAGYAELRSGRAHYKCFKEAFVAWPVLRASRQWRPMVVYGGQHAMFENVRVWFVEVRESFIEDPADFTGASSMREI